MVQNGKTLNTYTAVFIKWWLHELRHHCIPVYPNVDLFKWQAVGIIKDMFSYVGKHFDYYWLGKNVNGMFQLFFCDQEQALYRSFILTTTSLQGNWNWVRKLLFHILLSFVFFLAWVCKCKWQPEFALNSVWEYILFIQWKLYK